MDAGTRGNFYLKGTGSEATVMATLWLDDIRDPAKNGFAGATWVTTADEAIAGLQTREFEFASLDHDLSVEAMLGNPAMDERTGYTVVCWLEEHPEYWPSLGVRVHSMNPVGRKKMLEVIHGHYRRIFQ